MKSIAKTRVENDRRNGERGAALIMTLLVSTLLLIAGGALIMTTSMSATLAIDSSAEAQAYYAAEAGLNASVNVLRRNIQSSPAGTLATFRNAVTTPNLSLWLGYTGTMNGTTVVPLSVSPAMGYTVSISDPDNTPVADEPNRLLVRVTGYGPKASRKRMELVVNRHMFEFSPIATVLVRGNDDNTTSVPTFGMGNSNAKEYSGYDHNHPTNPSLPVFGVTHGNDFTTVNNEIASAKPNTVSGVEKVKQFTNSQLPSFLQTTENARFFLTSMQATAVSNNRYFTTTPTSFGSSSSPALTFVDGDCTLGDGAGLLIVTGKLVGQGNVAFKGIILVLGEGVFIRNGGGNGDTYGAIVVAKFNRTSGNFLSPTYDMNGGGDSTTGYDSDEVDRALNAIGLVAQAVREY